MAADIIFTRRFVYVCSLSLSVLFFLSVNFFVADASKEEMQARLGEIYSLYNEDPAESCRQLEDSLQSADVPFLSLPEKKKAYYFLANCHYQLKNFDKALSYYETVSQIDPEDPQPVVNAGHVYFERGQYAKAEKKYKEALRRVSGDDSEKTKIRAMLDRIPGKLRTKYTFSTSIGYDSNVNSGPSDTTHFLYEAFNYTLKDDEERREDFYSYNNISGLFQKDIDSKTSLHLRAGANNMNYFKEKNYNTSVFFTSMEYKKLFGDKSVKVSPYVNYQTLDDKSYQINGGLNLSGAVRMSEKIWVWPYGGGYFQNYYKEAARDALGIAVGSSASYKINEKTSWITRLFYTYNHADDKQFTYNNMFLGGGLYRVIAPGLTATAGYNLQLFYYAGINPAFGTARKDHGHKYYVNCDYSLKQLLNTDQAFLSLSVSYHDNNSNHSFQERERLFSAVTFTYYF